MYKWLWNALGWLLICIVLPIVVVYGGLFSLTRELPDVSGMPAAEAQQILEKAGFRVEKGFYKTDEMPVGIVARQMPRGDGRLIVNSTVRLDVSMKYSFLPVPDIVGLTYEEACRLLEEIGFRWDCSESYSKEMKKGCVISQSFTPGDMVNERHTFRFVVSKGEELIPVPNLVGMTESEARISLTRLGLLCTVKRVYSSTVAKDVVMEQNREPGSIAKRGFFVLVTVSKGIEMGPVPDLSEKTPWGARSWLDGCRFALKIHWVVTDKKPSGTFISQSPAPQTQLARNTGEVTVIYSIAPGMTPVPRLVGLPVSEAQKALDDVGLKMIPVAGSTNRFPPGTVYGQSPRELDFVPDGSEIRAYINRG